MRAAAGGRLERLARAAAALDPDAGARQALLDAVGACAERYLGGLAEQRGYRVPAPRRAGAFAVGEAGRALADVLAEFERDLLPPGTHPAAGRHLAFIPGGGLFHGALADFLAAATNKFTGLAYAAPEAVRMEHAMVRWAADLVGYPASAAGSTVSGGSLAHLTAIVAARDAAGLRAAGVARAAVYRSEDAHHSIDKALRVAGLGECPVRVLPVDARRRLRAEALAAAVDADRRAGLRPWLIVATAGTTNAGAVDPLAAVAAVASRAGCWFHVDAAYGGFFALTERGRARLRGIERSDSLVLDPHKGLFLPWGSGMVLVRDAVHLVASQRQGAEYLRDAALDLEALSPCDLSPELSRPFRALRMWLPLAALGVAPFRAALDEKLALARYFHRRARALGFATGGAPDLSVVTFRWAPPGASLEAANALNEELATALRDDGRAFLSSTELGGRLTLRMAALSHRTHRRHLDGLLAALAEHAARPDA